jgi:uncharacterized protein
MDKFEKLADLKAYLQSLESLAVAYSGGVDSTFLLKVAHEVLGDRVLAVTARSEIFPQREFREAQDFVKSHGINHVSVASEELEAEGFAANPPNRCYLCKKELFTKILAIAAENHLKHVAEGSNIDDNGDYRPGLQAVAELGVLSPLREAGLTKHEIRELSQAMALPTWDKPSFACLASRFPYGERITRSKLAMVDQAEQLLLDRGFTQVRVRHHGAVARIELRPEEFGKLLEANCNQALYQAFKEIGFNYVALDLQGYRTGSMNEGLITNDEEETRCRKLQKV